MIGRRIYWTVLILAGVNYAGLAIKAEAQTHQNNAAAIEILRGEVEALKKQQADILRELRVLQNTERSDPAESLQAPPFKGATISIENSPVKGSYSAPIAIIEFSDYECPFCRRFATRVLPELAEKFIQEGKLLYVFRDFPLPSHPAAAEAAAAAHCAGEQNKYWEMHDRLFGNPKAVSLRDWTVFTKAIGLDEMQFSDCMGKPMYKSAVTRSITEGRRLGITGTPSFFLGEISEDGKTVKASARLVGAKPYKTFEALINQMLQRKAK